MRAILPALFLAAVAATPAFAQDKTGRVAAETAAAPAPQAWVVTCTNRNSPGKLGCLMEQALVAETTRQKILLVSVAPAEKAGEYRMRINLPHGIHLPAGVQLSVDGGGKQTYPIETADQNGSYASAAMDAAFLAALKAGKLLKVATKTASKDDIVFEVTLDGFAASFGLLAGD